MIDTANKRASAIGIALAVRLVLPVPHGVIDQGDRQHVAYCYRGISAAPAQIPPAYTPVRAPRSQVSWLGGVRVRGSHVTSVKVDP